MPKFGALLILAATPLFAQSSWFTPSLLERPDVKKAMQSVDDRAAGITEEWIKLVEIPAPSTKEQVRAKYIRAEMEKLGLTQIRTDDISNVSGVRKGTGGGPTVVFAAHADPKALTSKSSAKAISSAAPASATTPPA